MDHYRQLAGIALAQCPPGHDVKLAAELDDGYSELDLRYRRGEEEVRVTGYAAEASFAMHLCLEAIREEMAGRSGQKWSRCVFRVFRDGTFKLDVEY
ncbi:MAG: hypothetical protein ABWX67_08830 [Allosphingosinicella sp.]